MHLSVCLKSAAPEIVTFEKYLPCERQESSGLVRISEGGKSADLHKASIETVRNSLSLAYSVGDSQTVISSLRVMRPALKALA